MGGAYRCGEAVSCNEVIGILVAEADGTTTHLPLLHPQLPAPQSRGPSQDAVHKKLHTWIEAWFTQLVGWQHCAGTQSSAVVQVWLSRGAVVATGVGMVVVVGPPGDGEVAVHPVRRTAAMQVIVKARKVLSM
jgi:hypothetical protein